MSWFLWYLVALGCLRMFGWTLIIGGFRPKTPPNNTERCIYLIHDTLIVVGLLIYGGIL